MGDYFNIDASSEQQYSMCYAQGNCNLTYCRKQRTRYIYGLIDPRTWNIFYVGLTFDMLSRFQDHMQDKRTDSVKAVWVQNILENGSYPLPLVLYEFQAVCDQYSRAIEQQIAEMLREDGHTAISDDTTTALRSSMQLALGEVCFTSKEHPVWDILDTMALEIVDRINDTSLVRRMLTEFYRSG